MSPEELYNEYQHLGKQTVYHMYNNPKGICRKHRIELDDLLQYAATGLWKACLSFNPEKGTKFQTHAINHIKWHINERLNRETSMIRYSCNREYNENEKYGIISMDVEINDDASNNTYHDIVASDSDVQTDAMSDIGSEYILSKLNDQQKQILEMQEKGMSYKQIGDLWNMTGANVKYHIYKVRKQLQTYHSEVV